MRYLSSAALAAVSLLVSASSALATPLSFQHSGRLLDVNGEPIHESVTLTVGLSTTEGGTPFWTEEFTDVQLDNGYFSVEIGAGPPALTADDFDAESLWLSTSFPGGATTNHRLLAVPYAARAAVADSVAGVGALGHGSIVQMEAVQSRTITTYSAPASGTGTAITPLDIVMTPRKAGNKMVLEWTIHGEMTHNALFVVTRNGSLLANATNGSNNRWAGITTSNYDQNNSSTPDMFVVRIVDMNTLDTQSTYRVHVRAAEGANHTLYFNRTVGSTGADGHETGLSVGTATEIWQEN